MSLPEITSEMLLMLYEALGGTVARLLIRFFVFFGVVMAFLVMTTRMMEVFGSIKELAPYGEAIANLVIAVFLVSALVFLMLLAMYWIAPRFGGGKQRERRMQEMERKIDLILDHLEIDSEASDGKVHPDD